MPVQADVMIRNNMPGPTVLALDPRGGDEVTWQGKGDPNGGDIQPVSEAMLNSVPFKNAVRRGIISVVAEGDEALDEYDRLQREDWQRRSSSMNQEGKAAIEPRADNDLVTLKCVGPSAKAGIACNIDVVVREKKQYEQPPLCDQHKMLAPEFIPMPEFEGGKQITRWSRMAMGERQRFEG